jgi:hypothetical protein
VSDDLSMDEFFDGLALWQEHRPQSAVDWRAIAARVNAEGGPSPDASPVFTALARLGLGAPEIARILGHADGGQLALRTYIHISENEAIDKAKLLYSMPRLKAVGE